MVDRRLLRWGVFLMALGAIPAAVQWGLIDESVAGDIIGWWPLLLIAWGIGILLGRTSLAGIGGVLTAGVLGLLLGSLLAGGVASVSGACIGNAGGGEVTTRSGTADGDRFSVDIELSCGDLAVTRAPGTTWTLTARHAPGRPPRIESGPSSLEVRTDASTVGFPPFTSQPRREWTMTLPTTPGIDVGMTLNAGSGALDLGGGEVTAFGGTFNAASVEMDLSGAVLETGASLGMTFNAASATLILPAGSLDGGMTLNASSLKLCVAPEAALRIEHQGNLSSADLGSAGLLQVGGAWQTPGYEAASQTIHLSMTSTLSSLTLDRTGGCR